MTIQQPPERFSRPAEAAPAAAVPAAPALLAPDGALLRVLPFAAYIAFIIIADVLERSGAGAASLRWVYPVKIAVVVALLLAFRRHYSELQQGMTMRAALAAVVAGALVFALWIILDADWMQIGTSRGFDPTGDDASIDWPLALIRIAGAALVVPLMEELFWRSFLLRWIQQRDFLLLRPAQVGVRAVAISVVLFGIEHNLWLAGMVAGLAYTLLYLRSESLWTPILGHAVTNGLLAAWVMATGSWNYW